MPVFDYAAREVPKEDAWRGIHADYVTTDEGTGVVHTAPAFGADDYEAGQKEGIPMYNPIDEEGRFTEKVPEFAGIWFKDADREIGRAMREKGLRDGHEPERNRYPLDRRNGTQIQSDAQ